MVNGMRKALLATLVVAVLALAGCTRVELERGDWGYTGVGEANPASFVETVDLGGAERADVFVRMGVGELTIGPDAGMKQLMRGKFEWSHDELQPRVATDVSGDTAQLVVEHGRIDFAFWPRGNVRSVWELKLSDRVPIDLDIDIGAGQATLLLGDLDLSDLNVDLGVGDVTIDLSGPVSRDLSARVDAGVGELTLRLPSDVGVRVSGRTQGLGDYRAEGFTARGDSWVNPAWGSSPREIDIELSRGVGMVTLELVK